MRPITCLVLALCASAAHAQDAIGVRIAASAAAAERLQGPLDGNWNLADKHGRTLFVLEITDPPAGGAPQCAWRSPDGGLGLADCVRRGSRLTMSFTGLHAHLQRRGDGIWRGVVSGAGRSGAVTLRRN